MFCFTVYQCGLNNFSKYLRIKNQNHHIILSEKVTSILAWFEPVDKFKPVSWQFETCKTVSLHPFPK